MPSLPDPNEKKTERLSLHEQIADTMLNLLAVGGITGGSLGAFWALFNESDLPKAIASLSIGLGISYGARLLKPIHEGTQRRLERTGQAIDAAIDQTFAKVSGFEDQYLLSQALACQVMQSDGAGQKEGVFTPLLEEAFVPLELSASQLSVKTNSVSPEFQNELVIWDLFKQAEKQPTFRQVAILAWGGYGKTTLLKHVAFVYSRKQHNRYKVPRKIPILLMLRRYWNVIAHNEPPDLPELISTYHVPSLPASDNLQAPTNWAKEILKKGNAVVMLDGFDEIPESNRSVVSEWISSQMYRYPRSIFILTSRPRGYSEGYTAPKFNTTLFIKAFSASQQRHFIERWYLLQELYANGGRKTPDGQDRARRYTTSLLSQIEQSPELMDMAANPLLLNMIANLYRVYLGGELPKRRTELYQEICRLQLSDRPSSKQIRIPYSIQESQAILQGIALMMVEEHKTSISAESLIENIRFDLDRIDDNANPVDFLKNIVQVSELLIERESGEYEFAHSTFQMYLAAREILQQQQEELLINHSNDHFWRETILLYIEQLRDPRNFLRKLLAPISNPYVVGNPVTGELFVGREDVLRRFKELWGASNQIIPSVILYGHRRMGKTSILRNLSEHIRNDLIVDFNMQRVGYVRSTGELLSNLAIAIYYVLPVTQRQHLDEPLELDFLNKNPTTIFDLFLKKLDPLRNNQRIIIAVDEFEIIENLIKEGTIDVNLLAFWRSLIQTYSWFVMVFAGLYTLQEMTHDYWNPLFGSVQTIPVSFLGQKATEVLITRPSADFNLEYTTDAVNLIYDLTHGQPYLTQLICHNLVSFFNNQRFEQGIYRESPLTTQDVETVIDMPEFYRDGNAYFNGIWEQAAESRGEDQLRILKALSYQPSTLYELMQQTSLSQAQVCEALQTLEQHDVIQQQSGLYTYKVELMRRWVTLKFYPHS